MADFIRMPTITEMLDNMAAQRERDSSFECPYCGHQPDMSECDVYGAVSSMWGDDPHNYNCEECGEDFIVDERVTRAYSSRKIGEPK